MTDTAPYQIRYNRSSYHIAGLAERTQSGGEEKGGVVAYYAESACPALTRSGHRMARGESFDSAAEALKQAELLARINNMNLCKRCQAAAEAEES